MEWASGDRFEGEWRNGVIQVSHVCTAGCFCSSLHFRRGILFSVTCLLRAVKCKSTGRAQIILCRLTPSTALTVFSLQGNGIFSYADGGKYTGDWNQVWPRTSR